MPQERNIFVSGSRMAVQAEMYPAMQWLQLSLLRREKPIIIEDMTSLGQVSQEIVDDLRRD